MADPRFIRNDLKSVVAHTIEELGKLQAALGKTLRWGWKSVNPLLPANQQETNAEWVWRELDDAEQVLRRLRIVMLERRLAPTNPTKEG